MHRINELSKEASTQLSPNKHAHSFHTRSMHTAFTQEACTQLSHEKHALPAAVVERSDNIEPV